MDSQVFQNHLLSTGAPVMIVFIIISIFFRLLNFNLFFLFPLCFWIASCFLVELEFLVCKTS